MKPTFSTVIITALVFLFGCVSGSPPQGINEIPLTRITEIDSAGLFASGLNGRKLAVSRRGLQLLDLESDSKRKLSSETPVALAWSLDNSSLAAAFPVADYETILAIYSDQGKLLHETLLPVALSQMVWSVRGDLLVTGFALKIYSFGGNLRQVLYHIDAEQVVEKVLADTSLKPATAKKLAPIMQSVQPVVFSPYGDELVFVKLHDPPALSPYQQLQYMNWESGAERSLGKISLQPVEFFWRGSESSVDVMAQAENFSLPLWPSAEESAEQPRVPFYQFAKGRLYYGEKLVADWGDEARLQILVDGRYFLAQKGRLYFGDGLQSASRVVYNEKAWTLRRWRFEDLITSDEYLNLLEGKP
jgi:hypothetical protein